MYPITSYELRESTVHGDVIKWKQFPRYWPFVWGIHWSPAKSPHKGQWRGALMFSLICALNKRLSKQSRGWWFETPSRSLWRHCNALSITIMFGTWKDKSRGTSPMIWDAFGNTGSFCEGINCSTAKGTVRCFSRYSLEQTVEQTIKLSIMWDTMASMWCHCNEVRHIIWKLLIWHVIWLQISK